MPITPYALNVKGMDFGQSVNMLNAVRQMQAANQQREMNALAMQKAQRDMAESDALRGALSKYDVTTPEGINALRQLGPKGFEYASALDKAAIDRQEAQAKMFDQNMKYLQKGAASMPDTPESYASLYNATINDHPELKSFLPHPSQYEKGKTMPALAFSAEDLLKSRKPFAVGGEAVFDPVTGEFSYPTKQPKEVTDWQAELAPDGKTIQYFSPSTGRIAKSTGSPIKGLGGKGAAGQIPGAREAAQENISNVLDEVDNALEGLKGLGEIRQTGAGLFPNIKASVASSETGQAFGKILGTAGQAYRDRIKTVKPLFTTQLAQATGLNSKQLDSNKELQLFLDTINDPSVDYYVAKSQLQLLKQMFASGAIQKSEEGLTSAMKVVNAIAKKEPSKQSPQPEAKPAQSERAPLSEIFGGK